MLAPKGDARNTMAFAMSSAEIMRPSDDFASASARITSGETPRAFALLANTLSIRLPATAPGQIALTRMPSAPNSIDSDFVKPITAHLDAAYGVRSGKPKRPAADERFVMLGFLLFRKCGIASCTQLNWPVILTASVRSQSGGSIASHAAVGPAMPALLTRTSRPPSVRSASSNNRATAVRSATSQTLRVNVGSVVVSALSASRSTSHTCTRAPSRANTRAVARPMPLAPAVINTRASLSWRSMGAFQSAAPYVGHAFRYHSRDQSRHPTAFASRLESRHRRNHESFAVQPSS